MSNFIAFMDILGTKATAIANPVLYREQIEWFHDCIEIVLKRYGHIKCYVYSDCAYFSCRDLKELCKGFILLREDLFSHRICFNAAICEGELCELRKNINKSLIIDFKNKSVVDVYSKQSRFSGAGIYIDPDLIKREEISLKDLTVKSLYKSINKYDGTDTYLECFDLKFGRISVQFIKNILIMYLRCYLSDKRAARYYYTPYTTYLRGLDIDCFTKEFDTIEMVLELIVKIDDKVISNVFVLILINCIYDAKKETLPQFDDLSEINIKLQEVLDFIYKRTNLDSVNNIKEYSKEIISNENKMLLVDYLLNKK